ncbi:hypothetical protein [Kordiimonas marina]|uniref:hypothetical protein n=1 Tax=Kordiimonas marina TaxID=2872312 RepID=UPI001FF44C4F|nr:hypothetical protein [Kordiimonas marina]MCJ9429686.1 hypothetical protein [Kordiimonas marina]
MPLNPTLNASVTATLKAVPPAITSLRDRKDFAYKNPPFDIQGVVKLLTDFKQQLTITQSTAKKSDKETLLAMTQKAVQPAISEVMMSNTKIMKMLPLNTNQTITSDTAKNQNIVFESLEESTQKMVADLLADEDEVAPAATAAIAIRSIQFTSRHGGGVKTLQRNGQTMFNRADGVAVGTQLDAGGGAYNNLEWDITRGGGGPEPFSQTMNTAPTLSVVCRVTATNGPVTVASFAGQLNGTTGTIGGANYGPANFQIALNQNTMNPVANTVVNPGVPQDFTVTFTGGTNFPTEIGLADLGLTITVNSNAPAAQNTVAAASTAYLTFANPAGTVTSVAANNFTLGGAVQTVTPARLELAIKAVRDGRNAIVQNLPAVPVATGGVPGFAFNNAESNVDAIFLFLKSRGITFTLNYRWVPGMNQTGLVTGGGAAPGLHTYLWMSMSPLPIIVPPANRPRTEAWAECHNLAVGFILICEILGLAPFVINYGTGGGNQLGYAMDYALPRRNDGTPYGAQVNPRHGRLTAQHTRNVIKPSGANVQQNLCFVDQYGGINNFEGVTVFNNQRLYPIGEVILADNNRDTNADNYYCAYPHNIDYVDPANNLPVNFNNAQGLVPLVFADGWLYWFFTPWGLNWQQGYDTNPYPGVYNPVWIQAGAAAWAPFGAFWWQD